MGETPVMPHGPVALIQPDYVTLKHKWVANIDWAELSGGLKREEFRVNSPIDPYITNSTFGHITNKRFNGFNEQASRYRYYRLLSNHITFTFCRFSDGQTVGAVEDDSGPVACGINYNPSNRYEIMSASVANWMQLAQARFTDWGISQGKNDKMTFTVDYTPGSWNTSIDEQHKERLWTPVIQHQGPDDRIVVWFQPLHSNIDVHIQLVVTMTATIQYREWDNQIVERMFISDAKPDGTLEIPVGATTAFTDATDAAPAPDTYLDEEIDEEL